MTQKIKPPAHYDYGAFEPRFVITAWGLDTNHDLASAIEYIARHSRKGTALDDLKKAKWRVEQAIAKLEAAQ